MWHLLSNMSRSGLNKRPMLMGKLIDLLLIFRSFLWEIPALPFLAIVLALLIGKYFKEGFTVGTLGQFITLSIITAGGLLQWPFVTEFGSLLAALSYIFIEPTIYELPECNPKIGLRQNYSMVDSKRKLYWTEWFPLKKAAEAQVLKTPWARPKEMDCIVGYKFKKHPLAGKFVELFMSYIKKYNLKLGKGEEAESSGTILFSHGRGGSPYLYSNFYKFLGRNRKVFSSQHSEVVQTPYTDMKEIKKYREVEVQERAKDILFLASKVPEGKDITLMGHSYGGATAITAYHLMPLSLRKRVTSIVLLDPWLFPLLEEHFKAEITCPILILANEEFLYTKDNYERNVRFEHRHRSNVSYICWKGASHLHQCDVSFVIGSTLGEITNSKLAGEMFEVNIEAIQIFLSLTQEPWPSIQKAMSERYADRHVDLWSKPAKEITSFKF